MLFTYCLVWPIIKTLANGASAFRETGTGVITSGAFHSTKNSGLNFRIFVRRMEANFSSGEYANRPKRPSGNSEGPVNKSDLNVFVEDRRPGTGRSCCMLCCVDSKDSPPSFSFSRLKELELIHAG